MNNGTATLNNGSVRLGEVEAPAAWRIGDGECVEIRFEIEELSLAQRKLLEHYRQSSAPIHVKLPSERRAKVSVVVGFDRSAATFFVSRNGAAHAATQSS